jgi:ADP-heptose:LPS heptosyltransferase
MKTIYVIKRYVRILWRAFVGVVLLVVYTKKKLVTAPRTLVVVQAAQLGDMVCTTPLFHAIKKHLPTTKLIVVGTKGGEGILQSNPDIDEYIVLDEKNLERTARALRAQKIDAGIVAVPSLDSLQLLALARIPFIVTPELVNGKNPANTKLYRFLSSFVVRKPHVFGAYAPREYLTLLEPFGITEEDTTKHLAYSSEALENVLKALSENGISSSEKFVCIAPGAGNKIKQWPPERFAEAASYIWDKFQLPIVILGSANDSEEVKGMQQAITPGMRCMNTCGNFSLDETKALISRASLLIAADTMVIYVAEAFNVPLIDIVGPVAPNEQPPQGPNRVLVIPPYEYVPQLHIMNARVYDAEEARKQVMSITVEMVTKAVATLLL